MCIKYPKAKEDKTYIKSRAMTNKQKEKSQDTNKIS